MMTSVQATACGFLLVVGLAGWAAADTTTIADFSGDWVAGTAANPTRTSAKADGWAYLWNAAGTIGMAADNYKSLVWNEKVGQYATESAPFPCSVPGSFLVLYRGGGHPGVGSTHVASGIDYYAIAAYTIKKGDEGLVSIADSSIKVPASPPVSNGVELRVYVNDKLITSFMKVGDQPTSFNGPLGVLKAGDNVYVAVGPNGLDTGDSFALSYKLVLSRDP